MHAKLILLGLLFSIHLSSEQKNERSNTIYSPVGKRDPFRSPNTSALSRSVATLSPLEKYTLEQLQLRAILQSAGKRRAMFEDPEGKTFIVDEGDLIGRERGTVSRVLNREVIITQRTENYLGVQSLFEKVVSLPVEDDSLINRAVAGGAEPAIRALETGNPTKTDSPAENASNGDSP